MKPNSKNEETILEEALSYTSKAACDAYLDGVCADDSRLREKLEALIQAHHEAGGFMQTAVGRSVSNPNFGEGVTLPEQPLTEAPGRRIGRYKLLQQIGEGGFGVVFMAEQEEPVRRLVAFKIIKLGMDTKQVIARFEAERQALALMDHPNIAKVLDAGATDTGRPYFVMELVKGISITQFCDKNKLSTSDRLKLYMSVCQAIQHAHQKGIIHRDIKPSNLLVTLEHGEPMVKVIDFGIAKAINQRLTEKTLFTNFAQMIGTPAYMSPEQAEMGTLDIDTRTDIYSLGVLLYELLTGTTPIPEKRLRSASYMEMQRLIREEDAQRPSTRLSTMNEGDLSLIAGNRASDASALGKLFRTDLDWIAMKALEKDRRRRYDTAHDLLLDVQRHLGNEPVLAKPPSTLYKTQKFIRRNQIAVGAGASLVLIFLLVLVLVSISYQRERAARSRADTASAGEARQRQRAENEAARATEMALDALRSGYASDMQLAQYLLEKDNRGRTVDLLEKYRPQTSLTNLSEDALPDLRGWEWHYLASITRGQELAVLRGHESRVTDVAYSPDGRWLASSEIKGIVNVWDTQTRALAKQLRLPDALDDDEEIFVVAFSPGGNLLAASVDVAQRIFFWAVPSWHQRFVLTNAYRANALAFSPDGRLLAAAGHNPVHGVVIWNLSERVPLGHWPLPNTMNNVPFALAFSADSKVLAYDLSDGRLGRWDVELRRDLPAIEVDAGARSIHRALFSQDGTLAAACTIDGLLRVWSLPEWKPSYTLTNEWLLALSHEQDLLVTARKQALRHYRLRTGEYRGASVGHLESLSAGAISPRDRVIVTASTDKTVRLWAVNPPDLPKLTLTVSTNAWSAPWDHRPQLTADGRFAFALNTNGTFSVWNVERLEQVETHPWPIPNARVLDVAPGGQMAAVGGWSGEVVLVDLASDQVARQIQLGSNYVLMLRFSPDGSRLAVAHREPVGTIGDPYHLEVFKTDRLERLRELRCNGGSVHSAAFTPDNRYLVFGSWSSLAELVDLEHGKTVASFRGQQGRMAGVAITPDARLVATCLKKGEGSAWLWDARTGKKLHAFRGAWDEYEAIALSSDGSRLAAAAGGVEIWDLQSRRLVQTLPGPDGWIGALAWTPDMKQLTTASARALLAWRAETFELSPPVANVASNVFASGNE